MTESSFENVDFDDILDTWSNCQRHSYRWEGETGVRNFEQLTKDLGYDYGIENFLADNPGAIQTLLEWISEHAEKGGSEWKANLAKACDYDPNEDDDDWDEDGDHIVPTIPSDDSDPKPIIIYNGWIEDGYLKSQISLHNVKLCLATNVLTKWTGEPFDDDFRDLFLQCLEKQKPDLYHEIKELQNAPKTSLQ